METTRWAQINIYTTNLHFPPNFFCIGLNVNLLQTKFLSTVFKIFEISSEVIAALIVCAQ